MDLEWTKPRYYGMDGKPMSMEEWVELMENTDRHVAEDYLRLRGHVYHVSTVLLGLDHSFRPDSPPLIFETMVFADDDYSGFQDIQVRYSTKEQAKAGHARIVAMVRKMVQYKPKQLLHNGRKP